MSQPETVLTNQIRRAILQAYPDAWILKAAGGRFQSAGVPDLLVCIEGRLIGIEVKCQRPGESAEHARQRATVLQLDQLDRLHRAGAVAVVALSAGEAVSAIARAAPGRSDRL